jgi:hypothetical protein
MADSYMFSTVGETDFYIKPECLTATHLLIINGQSPSNLPSILGIELGRVIHEEAKVGFITSKHVLTKPHRILNEGNPMWSIFRYKDTLVVIINAPPIVSRQMAVQRNEWLFNYPPIRDIVMRFRNVKKIGTLTTFALNRLYIEDTTFPDECVKIKGAELGQEETIDALQDMWSWLPVEIGTMMGIDSAMYVMPPETAKATNAKQILPAKFKEMCDMLRKDGFAIPPYSAKRAQDTYTELTSEALEAIKELIGAKIEESKISNAGVMFQ